MARIFREHELVIATHNAGKAKEIYVRNCVLTDVDAVMADDNLFYQAFFAVTDLLPFQKPEVEML